MEVITTYDEVKAAYPEYLSFLEKARKKSKAQDAKRSLNSFKFSYYVAEIYGEPEDFCGGRELAILNKRREDAVLEAPNFSMDDVLSGCRARYMSEVESLPVEDQLSLRLPKLLVCIEARLGRCRLCTEVLEDVPEQVKQHIRDSLESRQMECSRIAALSPEEWAREVTETLVDLRRTR